MGIYFEVLGRSLFAIVTWVVFTVITVFTMSIIVNAVGGSDSRTVAVRTGTLIACLVLPAFFIALAVFSRESKVKWLDRLIALLQASIFVVAAVLAHEFLLRRNFGVLPSFLEGMLASAVAIVALIIVINRIEILRKIHQPAGSLRPKDVIMAERLIGVSVLVTVVVGLTSYTKTIETVAAALKQGNSAAAQIDPHFFVPLLLVLSIGAVVGQVLAVTRLGSVTCRGLFLFFYITGLWSVLKSLFDPSAPIVARLGTVAISAIHAYILVLLFTKETSAWLRPTSADAPTEPTEPTQAT